METTKKIYVAPQVESLTVELEEGIVQSSPGGGTMGIQSGNGNAFSKGFTEGNSASDNIDAF